MGPGFNWLGQTTASFLDAIAARQPTPGGGSVAAAAGALAAAMGRMVAAYSPPRGASPDAVAAVRGAADELSEADGMLRRLVNEDAAAYQAYADSRKSTEAGERERATALALAVPMEIVAVACSVLRTLERCKDLWNPNLISDLGVAAVLAEACVRAAAYNVRINLKLSPEADPSGEAAAELAVLVANAATLQLALCEFVNRRL